MFNQIIIFVLTAGAAEPSHEPIDIDMNNQNIDEVLVCLEDPTKRLCPLNFRREKRMSDTK